MQAVPGSDVPRASGDHLPRPWRHGPAGGRGIQKTGGVDPIMGVIISFAFWFWHEEPRAAWYAAEEVSLRWCARFGLKVCGRSAGIIRGFGRIVSRFPHHGSRNGGMSVGRLPGTVAPGNDPCEWHTGDRIGRRNSVSRPGYGYPGGPGMRHRLCLAACPCDDEFFRKSFHREYIGIYILLGSIEE